MLTESKPNIPIGKWVKCDKCKEILYKEDVHENYSVCPSCGEHFKISARRRIEWLIDAGTFDELNKDMQTTDPLNFPDYKKKMVTLTEKTKINEAVTTGVGNINGEQVVISALDGNFLMGSMGSVVGEKITCAIEKAIELKLPLIIISMSGGARMQEGIVSLMQMAKTSGALSKFHEAGLLYISIFTNPTMGGVTASFASLGDIILAEPKALIGFAGPRVIEQTIKTKLPEGFQTSEFLLEHGFIDKIVERKDLKSALTQILQLHKG